MEVRNYLLLLPEEIKLKICSYLKPVDLIYLKTVYAAFENVVLDGSINKNVSVNGDYRISAKHITSFICAKPISLYICKLNVTNIYWIPIELWKRSIVCLPSLESLQAAGTKLDFILILKHMKKLKNLRKIAVTLLWNEWFHTSVIPNFHASDYNKFLQKITHLVLFYYTTDATLIPLLKTCLLHLENLEVLWVINIAKTMKRFKCQPGDEIIKSTWNSFLLPMRKRLREIFTNDIILVPTLNDNDKPFLTFVNGCKHKGGHFVQPPIEDTMKSPLHFTAGCCIDDLSEAVVSRPDHLQLTEDGKVYIYHEQIKDLSSATLMSIWHRISRTFTVNQLKFSVCYCIWCNCQKTQKRKRSDTTCYHTNLINNMRVVESPCEELEILSNTMLRLCPNIEELELDSCDGTIGNCFYRTDMTLLPHSFENICHWKSLKNLTLNHIPFSNGKFIIEIFQSCTLLEVVKLGWHKPADTFTNYVCTALSYAKNLKDFRYEIQQIISIASIIMSLTSCPKLERTVIKCSNKRTNPQLLLKFLSGLWVNPTVIFVGILMKITQKDAAQIRKEINLKIKADRRKVFLIQSEEYADNEYLYKHLPIVHIQEMIDSTSSASSVDLINCASFMKKELG